MGWQDAESPLCHAVALSLLVYLQWQPSVCAGPLLLGISKWCNNNTVSVPRFEFLQRDFSSVWLVGRLLVGTEMVVKSAA